MSDAEVTQLLLMFAVPIFTFLAGIIVVGATADVRAWIASRKAARLASASLQEDGSIDIVFNDDSEQAPRR